MRLSTPAQLGQAWLQTLRSIEEAHLLSTILYVDLCNEFPLHLWAPFFSPDAGDADDVRRDTPECHRWMRESIALLRTAYPDLDCCFSFTTEFDVHQDVAVPDLLERHLWMTRWSDFSHQVGSHYERFS